MTETVTELDLLVPLAEKILNWYVYREWPDQDFQHEGTTAVWMPEFGWFSLYGPGGTSPIDWWNPLTELEDAFELLDEADLGVVDLIYKKSTPQAWSCRTPLGSGVGDTPQRAICEALLRGLENDANSSIVCAS